MKGLITLEKNILGEDGKTYTFDTAIRGMDDEGYPEVLMDAKEVGGRGWMSRQSLKPFIGMTIEFVVSPTGFPYNFYIPKQKHKSMCLTTMSLMKTAKKDFYTLKIAENVTLERCLSYYQCVEQKYKELYTADMKEMVDIGTNLSTGLHSFYDIKSMKKNLPYSAYFQDCRGVILCRVPKGAKYYLGINGDLIANQLELLEPIVIWNNSLEQYVEIETMGEALIHAYNVCLSYNLNMKSS